MSIIDAHISEHELFIKVKGPFNYFTVELIKVRIESEMGKLVLDLSACDIVDSEATIFLYSWQKSGKSLRLIEPPALLFRILHTLELEDDWNVSIAEKNN